MGAGDHRSFIVSGVVIRGWLFFSVGYGGLTRGTKFEFLAEGGGARGLSCAAWGLSVSDFRTGREQVRPYLDRRGTMGLRHQGGRQCVRGLGDGICRGFGLRGEFSEDSK